MAESLEWIYSHDPFIFIHKCKNIVIVSKLLTMKTFS